MCEELCQTRSTATMESCLSWLSPNLIVFTFVCLGYGKTWGQWGQDL